MDPLTRLIHILAVAVYVGTTLDLAVVLLPIVTAETDPALQRRLLARGLRPFNVLSIGALGVLVVSGASALTDLKASMGGDYARMLWPLVGKLSLTFALVMVGTYVSFGLAHRIVRAEMGRLPVEPTQLAGMIRRLRGAAWLGLALAVWTTWVGLRLGR